MALFNNFDIADVIGEAYRHNKKVVEQDLQQYNDMLFKIIADEINGKREDILNQFKTKIQETSGKVNVVSIPLWTYNVRHFFTPREIYLAELENMPYTDRIDRVNADEERDAVYSANGWHWTIGLMSPVQWLDEETNWTLRPVPVDLIVRKTDLLHRLSNLFQGHVWITREYVGFVHEDQHCQARKIVLRAHFHVKGLNRYKYKVNALNAAKAKYLNYSEIERYDGYKPILTGPGLEPPQTPPASPTQTPAEPPPVQRFRWSCHCCSSDPE